MSSRYRRRPEDLKARASLYWPQELREQGLSAQVMTRLLETQETFVSILKVADASPSRCGSRARTFAVAIRCATGLMSTPTLGRLSRFASTSAVPEPMKGSNTNRAAKVHKNEYAR